MATVNRCPKCNARGSWLQRVDWDPYNKRWEVGCVMCGWRPRRVGQAAEAGEEIDEDLLHMAAAARAKRRCA